MTSSLDLLARAAHAHRSALVSLARREGLPAPDAFDCVQDALCTALRLAPARGLPEDGPSMLRYLSAIVRNAARNGRRRHRACRPHEGLDALEGVDVSAEDLIGRAQDRVRLRVCVGRLCDVQRAVLTLRLLEERAGEDVAVQLGISRAHVDVLLYRAKSALRACMVEPDARSATARAPSEA